MSVRWETEGLQTVGIVCLVIMFLKLMHLLGLIDITETGETTWDRCCNGGTGVWKMNAEEKLLIPLNATTQIFAESIYKLEVSQMQLQEKYPTFQSVALPGWFTPNQKLFQFCSGCGVNHRDYLEDNLLKKVFIILN